ncbi:MAG: TipAS antibiotic-recognition domain-containing protein, partial [Ruminococcus sp.]|nr:TipAS antibiotic-recognition domain-containing protein [Ruminococcus sp.]
MRNNEYEQWKNQYAEEVRERWGDTEAYRESEENGADLEKAISLLDEVMEGFAELNRDGVSPDSDAAILQ